MPRTRTGGRAADVDPDRQLTAAELNALHAHAHDSLRAREPLAPGLARFALQGQLGVALGVLPDLAWGCSAQGQLDFLAPGWAEYTGLPLEEQLGRAFCELAHSADVERMREAFPLAAQSGAPIGLDVRLRRHDGSFRWFRLRGQPLRAPSGAPRYCGSCVDVEDLYERKQEARVLAQAFTARMAEYNARLSREMRRRELLEGELEQLRRGQQAELERLASYAAHDLQEPLRAISGCAELLCQRYAAALGGDARALLDTLVQGSIRMRALTDALLGLARVEAQSGGFERVSSEAALRGAIENLGAAIAESGAQIAHGPLPELRAHLGQLTQLFQNLLGNAIKYRRGAGVKIEVSAEPHATGWQFAVRDDGIGIAPEDRERIFNVFERLHGRGEYAGHGLGLALCARIVRRHGGRIWVESLPGRGATFYFTLGGDLAEEDARR